MKYGFMMGVSPREPIARFAEVCKRAEELGFDQAWIADSQLIVKDPTAAMTLAAQATSKIKIGPGVSNPVTRHYTMIGASMAAVNEVSNGRAVIGIGVGDSAITPLGYKAAKVDTLRQIVLDLQAMSEGRKFEIAGNQLELLTHNGRMPVFVSASQPRMLRMAGAVADGVIVMGGANKELLDWQINFIAEGAKEAGRSLKDIFIDAWFAASIRDDVNAARDDVRAWVTAQSKWFSRYKDIPAVLEPFAGEFQRAYDEYSYAGHLSVRSGHSKVTSDGLCDLLAPAGPLEHCVEKIRPLNDLKIDRITFALVPGGRLERLRQIAEDLMPQATASAAA